MSTSHAAFGSAPTEETEVLATQLGARLRQTGGLITCAESCTGGLLAGAITAIPGSSAWFERSWVTYSNTAKTHCLGVSRALLDAHGAVSAEVVAQMALGALQRAGATLALAVSGVAGPDGGTSEKPVGLVWIGLAVRRGSRLDSWHENLFEAVPSRLPASAHRHDVQETATAEILSVAAPASDMTRISCTTNRFQFAGNRHQVRGQSVITALRLALRSLDSPDLQDLCER